MIGYHSTRRRVLSSARAPGQVSDRCAALVIFNRM